MLAPTLVSGVDSQAPPFKGKTVLKTAAACLVLALSGVGAAQAAVTGVSVQIEPVAGAGKLCLDAKGDRDSDGIPVIVYECHGSENQRWTITSSPDNKHAIIGLGGYCLDVRGGAARGNGTPVELYQWHFGANQRFSMGGDGRIREVESGKCLIASALKNDSPLVLDTCTNAPTEVFTARR